MRLVRRLVPQLGVVTVARWAWGHRGTVLRFGDLAGRAPALVRDGRTDDLAVEARSVLALDAVMPKDTSVRISGLGDGTVLLRGNPSAVALQDARDALCKISEIGDVRSDGTSQPTTADALLTAS
jgi:hypothetical protein